MIIGDFEKLFKRPESQRHSGPLPCTGCLKVTLKGFLREMALHAATERFFFCQKCRDEADAADRWLLRTAVDPSGCGKVVVGGMEVNFEGRDDEVLATITDDEFKSLRTQLEGPKKDRNALIWCTRDAGMRFLMKFSDEDALGNYALIWTKSLPVDPKEMTEIEIEGKKYPVKRNSQYQMYWLLRVAQLACQWTGQDFQEFLKATVDEMKRGLRNDRQV